MNAILRSYILAFRVAELQLCLQELGLSKNGLKADLQARLFAYFGEASSVAGRGTVPPREQHRLDSAGRLITRVYCRMKGLPSPTEPQRESIPTAQGAGQAPEPLANGALVAPAAAAAPAAPLSPGGAGGEGGAGRRNTQIRCVCGNNVDRGTMIQCEDDTCGVWQHCDCLGIPGGDLPEAWLCELCRLARADPFWRRLGAPLMPTQKLAPVQPHRAFGDGLKFEEDVPQLADRHFSLTHAQLDPLRRSSTAHQLQVACLMLGDPVPFRVHWPRMADLRVNAMQYRPYGRSAATKLGVNARDEPASVGMMCSQGRNRVSLAAVDSRTFCVLMQLARRRSVAEVKALMHAPETPVQGLARVRRQAGGGGSSDEDEDDAVQIGRTVLSLRCPLSGARMRTPARFAPVGGLAAFDLDTFLDLAARSRKWQCPHSMRALPVQELMLDAYLSCILPRLKDLPDVMEVEVSPEGQWRLPGWEGAWHSISEDPQQPLPLASVRVKPDPERAPTQDPGAGSDSDEEMSEAEELRRAAAAAASTSRARAKPAPEIINLIDSDDEDGERPQGRAAGQAGPSAPVLPPRPARPPPLPGQQASPQQRAPPQPPPPQRPPGGSVGAPAPAQLRHNAAPFHPGRAQHGPSRSPHCARSGYPGPYPGSVPGRGGGSSGSSGSRDIVRSQGLTIRLPQRGSSAVPGLPNGAPASAGPALSGLGASQALATASAAAAQQLSGTWRRPPLPPGSPAQYFSPLNGGVPVMAPPSAAAAGGYYDPHETASRYSGSYADTQRHPGGGPHGHSGPRPWAHAIEAGMFPRSPRWPNGGVPAHRQQQQQPYPATRPYPQPAAMMPGHPGGAPQPPCAANLGSEAHASGAAAGPGSSRPYLHAQQNGYSQLAASLTHPADEAAPAYSWLRPSAAEQHAASPAAPRSPPPVRNGASGSAAADDGLGWQPLRELEDELPEDDYRDWLDDFAGGEGNDSEVADSGAPARGRSSEIIELDSD